MKKTWLWAFSFLVLLLSFNLFVCKIYATEDPSATSSSQQMNYELPYPGLLPDSPLYFLRILRDKAVGFLISDPLKKTEFDLLQADKRLNASIYLLNKGKTSLALSTVSKAENYFEEALGQLDVMRMQGRSVADVRGKLENALQKHELELKSFIEKVNLNFKPGFENQLKRAIGFGERLSR
jgi:hypothetical protein